MTLVTSSPRLRSVAAPSVASLFSSGLEQGPDLIVQRQVFELGAFATRSGDIVNAARFGWESYGTLNQAGDNAILVNHFFLGFGHAAGRYSPDDRYPGFWDDLIGPGKAIDTRKYFVIAMDSLCNVYHGHPQVITTGPASINPESGERYAFSFPTLSIRDLVEAQRALLDGLGIYRLQAIIGAGLGGIQAYEFATAWPDRVARIIPICSTALTDGWHIAWMSGWTMPIRLDPAWNGGNYYEGLPPIAGLTEAMKMIYLSTRHWSLIEGAFGRDWADADRDPARSLADDFAVERALTEAALRRVCHADANHLLYLAKATQTFQIGEGLPLEAALGRLKAAVLTIHTPHDQLYARPSFRGTLEIMMRLGIRLRVVERTDVSSHVEAISDVAPVATAIARFLE